MKGDRMESGFHKCDLLDLPLDLQNVVKKDFPNRTHFVKCGVGDFTRKERPKTFKMIGSVGSYVYGFYEIKKGKD